MKTFFTFIAGLGVGTAACILVYFFTSANIPWEAYLETVIVPTATSVITFAGMVYAIFAPFIKKTNTSISMFDQATQSVNQTVETTKATKEEILRQKQVNDEMLASLEELKKELRSEIASVKETSDNTAKMVRIGFCNTEELVNNGYAYEILKVGKNEEEKL